MYFVSILFRVALILLHKNSLKRVTQADAKPDFFVGDTCIINKSVGDMHQKTNGIAYSGKQTVLVNKYMTSYEE